MNPVLNAIAQRSSTRGYTAEKLTAEQIEALISAGLQAPTAADKQEIHFSVLDGSHPILAEIEAAKNAERGIVMAPEHNFYYEAPTVIILSANAAFAWSALDAGIAVENMALAAESMGLGNLIIGCIKGALSGEKKNYFAQALEFPEGYEFEIAIAVGYKDVTKTPHTYDAAKQVSYIG